LPLEIGWGEEQVDEHGVTASPLSRRYGDRIDTLPEDAPERADVPTLAVRRLR
jgi:hypothetical protein